MKFRKRQNKGKILDLDNPRGAGFKIPFVANIPIEQEMTLNEKVKRDVTYTSLRNQMIQNKFANQETNLREIANYLMKNFQRELSYEQIARDLNLNESCIRMCVSELNFWRQFPIRMVFVRDARGKIKKGFIQSCLKTPADTEACIQRRQRTIASMEQSTENIENAVKIKKQKQVRKREKLAQQTY